MSVLATLALVLNTLAVPPVDVPNESAPIDMTADMTVPAATTGVWIDSFEKGKALAAERQLPMLLHFEAVWCGACRTMESSVMNKPDVQDELGESVIGVRIDADQHRDLISRYSISSLPTEVVVDADGKELARYEGGVSLASYVRRLRNLPGTSTLSSRKPSAEPVEEAALRSCLIVRRDGHMVGLGGFSPVALTATREWLRGTEDFLVTYEGVDYFLRSADEVVKFTASPAEYVPRLHGCDLVALSRNGKVEPGAIEFGSFYKGKVFFFANGSNRAQFLRHPDWYASAALPRTATNGSSQYPFLQEASLE
jgi:YHS domain-containing protein